MRFVPYLFVWCALLLTSCEELIDIDLNEANARYVIEGQLTDLSTVQQIRVSQTVAFNEPINALPVTTAAVRVLSGNGRLYVFQHTGDGIYEHKDMALEPHNLYTLQVDIDDEQFLAQQQMRSYIDVDSTGIVMERIMNEDYYFPTFKFNDPQDTPDYYKYDMAINGGNFKFATVFNDKFNDGLFVTHQIADFDNDLKEGDHVIVRRSCVDKSVYQYWNEFQTTNPGTAAPGNPTSNISNGALGYFSVAPAKEYVLSVPLSDFDNVFE